MRTTNLLERFIKELNRRISQVGVFPNDRSWDRMTYLSWHYLHFGGYPNSSHYHSTRKSRHHRLMRILYRRPPVVAIEGLGLELGALPGDPLEERPCGWKGTEDEQR